MTQHDMVVDNADGLTVRTDFNAAMQALVTCNSGPVEPPDRFPGMLWLDLSVPPDGVLRQRNQSNTAWLPVLLSPDFRFPEADLYFGARTSPNRFVWNDKFDGSGNDILVLRDDGLMTLVPQPSGLPTNPGDIVTKSYVDASAAMPVGAIIYVAMTAIPASFLKANGASILRTSAPTLFAAIGTTYGSVDVDHFNLPDLRGEFIRGWDDGRGIDASRVFGSAQASAFASHTHTATAGLQTANHAHAFSDSSSATSSAGAHTHTFTDSSVSITASALAGSTRAVATATTSASDVTGSAGAHTHTVAVSGTTGLNNANHSHLITVDPQGGADTRPRNVAMLPCIKYQ